MIGAPLPLDPGEIAAELVTEPPTPIALRRYLNDGWSGYEVRFLADGYGHKVGDVTNYGSGSIRLAERVPDGWCPALDAARIRHAAIMTDDDEIFINDPITRAIGATTRSAAA